MSKSTIKEKYKGVLVPLKEQYKGVLETLQNYFSAYGGAKLLATSPYLHFSIFISMLLYGIWYKHSWWDISMSVLPNLLGFSLGGYAISLTLGNDKFQSLLSEKDKNEKHSPYIVISASFLHFIIMQFIAILVSFMFKSFGTVFTNASSSGILQLVSYFGFCVFIYSIMTGIAASLAIFNYSKMFDIYNSQNEYDSDEKEDD